MLYKVTIKNTQSMHGVRLDDLQKACAFNSGKFEIKRID